MIYNRLLPIIIITLLVAAPGCANARPATMPLPPAISDTAPQAPPAVITTAETAVRNDSSSPAVPTGPGAFYIDTNLAGQLAALDGDTTLAPDERQYRILNLFPDLDYRQIGSVLEGLTRAAFTRDYPPPHYLVTGGIEYFSPAGATVGEIDLMVLRADGTAVIIGEMKLSSNSERAMTRNRRHARQQLQRFRDAVASDSIAGFSPARVGNITLTPELFRDCDTYILMGPRGSTDYGYDRAIDISRDEGDALQQRLLAQ